MKASRPAVAVVGLGLMGTSLALAWRRAGAATGIVGVDPDAGARREARRRDAVDMASAHLDAAAAADVVVLAAPPRAALAMAGAVAAVVRDGALVTDVCSVKAPVVERYRQALGDRAAFVGGHPMAGSARSGAAAADADLFRGRPYVLTPTPSTPADALDAVEALALAAGARPLRVDPQTHDRAVARVSHLVQVTASALMLAAAAEGAAPAAGAGPGSAGEPAPGVDPLVLAGPGLRDTTRVAASPGALWAEILLLNREPVLAALADLEGALQRFRRALVEEDAAALRAAVDEGARLRTRLEAES